MGVSNLYLAKVFDILDAVGWENPREAANSSISDFAAWTGHVDIAATLQLGSVRVTRRDAPFVA